MARAPRPPHNAGFTLIELLISIVIFSIVMALAAGAFTNLLRGYQQRNVERHVFEEARFIMEKIVKEIRNGSVDYAYYYMHNEGLAPDDEVNYFDYYSLGSHEMITGVREISPLQDMLVVVSPDGTERSMFWASGYDFEDGDLGTHLGDSLLQASTPWDRTDTNDSISSALFKKMYYWSPGNPNNERLDVSRSLDLYIADQDAKELPMTVVPLTDPGENWSWYNDPDFIEGDPEVYEVAREAAGWRPISSPDVNIVDLRFIITPTQDPFKFWDTVSNVDSEFDALQSQPKVTILLTIEPDRVGRSLFKDARLPRFTLQRTVSARSYQQIYYNGWPRLD